jgi:hypothetical protein
MYFSGCCITVQRGLCHLHQTWSNVILCRKSTVGLWDGVGICNVFVWICWYDCLDLVKLLPVGDLLGRWLLEMCQAPKSSKIIQKLCPMDGAIGWVEESIMSINFKHFSLLHLQLVPGIYLYQHHQPCINQRYWYSGESHQEHPTLPLEKHSLMVFASAVVSESASFKRAQLPPGIMACWPASIKKNMFARSGGTYV